MSILLRRQLKRTISRLATTAINRSDRIAAHERVNHISRQQKRWCSKDSFDDDALDSMFASIDEQTYKNFFSMQTTLINDDGRKVTVIPMQHIASTEFFDSVIEEIAKNNYYLALMEGVLDSAEQLKSQDDQCFQLATNCKLHETCSAEFAAKKHYTTDEESDMFSQYHIPYPPPVELCHMELYFKPKLMLRSPLKIKNSDVTRDKILEIKDAKDREFFIINGRTDHCAKVLREYLAQPLQEYADCPGADSIAVCWGQLHCPLLIEDLKVRGFRVESTHRRDYGWSEDLYTQVCKNVGNTSCDATFMNILGA